MTSSMELITNALTETFGHEVEGIAPDRTLQDLELDSLASVEMALMLQEQTGIPLDDLTPETTIGELADRIDAARAAWGCGGLGRPQRLMHQPSTDIAITGLSVVSPAGIGASATWKGMLAGRSTATRDPQLAGLPVDISCRVPDFDTRMVGRKHAWRLDRFAAMAVLAAREAVTDARLNPADWDRTRVGVVIGTGTASMERYFGEFAKLADQRPLEISALAITRSVPNMAAAEIALDLAATGPNFAVSTACASGTTALGVARDLLRAGSCDIVLAGGAESVCNPVPAACFHRMGALSQRTGDPERACRPFDSARDGFVLAEGAAVLVLERPEHAQARGARPRAYLAYYGASCDAYHFAAPDPNGNGATAAITAAITDSRPASRRHRPRQHPRHRNPTERPHGGQGTPRGVLPAPGGHLTQGNHRSRHRRRRLPSKRPSPS